MNNVALNQDRAINNGNLRMLEAITNSNEIELEVLSIFHRPLRNLKFFSPSAECEGGGEIIAQKDCRSRSCCRDTGE